MRSFCISHAVQGPSSRSIAPPSLSPAALVCEYGTCAQRKSKYSRSRNKSSTPDLLKQTDRYSTVAKGFLDKLFGASKQTSDLDVEHEQGPIFAKIDTDSEGGLGGTSEGLFGPLAVLLIGFSQHELEVFRGMMIEVEADMVKPTLGTRRALIVSGMYGAEVTGIMAAYQDTGLPANVVWAAAVPNNMDKQVELLLEDLYRDHAIVKEWEAERESERERRQIMDANT